MYTIVSGRFTRWSRSCLNRVLFLSLLGLSAGPVPQACAQDASPDILVQDALRLINARNYEQAAPLLQELITRLKPIMSRNDSARRMVDFAKFHLGVAAFERGDYADAVRIFREYRQVFPDGHFDFPSLVMTAECHAMRDDWEKTAATAGTILERPRLDQEQRLQAIQLLSEARVQQRRWEEALPLLMQLFTTSRDAVIRNDAGVQYAICLVELNRFDELFALIPQLDGTPARYDIHFNLALIDAGDKKAQEGNYNEALLLYGLVYEKAELEQRVKQDIEQIEMLLQSLGGIGGLSLHTLASRDRKLRRILDGFRRELERIRAQTEYTQELRFRIAGVYYEQKRSWEALAAFRSLYEEFSGQPIAEQGLYSSFSTALDMGYSIRARDDGLLYLSAYPNGRWFDQVSLALVQMYAGREAYADAEDLAQHILSIRPRHEKQNQLLFQLGYARFQQEDFAGARDAFGPILKQPSESRVFESARYWQAMSLLFEGRFDDAEQAFLDVLDGAADGPIAEDAAYRIHVCRYGKGDLNGALDGFRTFIRRFPDSPLVAEAFMMVGDILAADGQLDQAVEAYREVENNTDTMPDVIYAFLQTIKILELENRYDRINTLARDHIETYGEQGAFTEAYYWIATSEARQGRFAEANDVMLQAIARYGDQARHGGIDMMIRDLILEFRTTQAAKDQTAFLDRLYAELQEAAKREETTLWLRLLTLFAEIRPAQRPELTRILLHESYIQDAGPVTLDFMGREAEAAGNTNFAVKVYRHFMQTFPDSDLAADAMMGLADHHKRQGDYIEAEEWYRRVASRFPDRATAGSAMVRVGDMHRVRGNLDQAIETYNTVLSIKEWKGEAWAEALYNIGLCRREQGETEAAFAFFQRVYVLYAGYPQWVARAYLQSAECLEQLGKTQEAVRTYTEMIHREDVKGLPEVMDAIEALQRLGAV